MVQRTDSYRPRRVNRYTPAMGYHSAVVHAAPYRVEFGAPALGDADAILDGHSIAAAGSTTTLLLDTMDAAYGRCLSVLASGAATSNVTVHGRDYLGQPMLESFTLNGTTPVVGTKAFKYIDKVVYAATASTTIDLGFNDKLGLPFRMDNILSEEADNVRNATLGTLVTPSLVDPQTSVTTDPRGTYDPNTTLDGVKLISGIFLPNSDINASGNGGLHGLAHYYA